ncbi:protein of unknown function [Candidatus Nitrosocosmicus franklandus]|uniref:Uncharacterized protein n=1 Tax=Candidatus Nitrosocosmicus franklandianus TaxID=1798806 RepID=A0A484IG11_9ARCH|nr:protein of unknown function [Candidatus Nitrosocosmicus franklandus]
MNHYLIKLIHLNKLASKSKPKNNFKSQNTKVYGINFEKTIKQVMVERVKFWKKDFARH